MPDLSATANAFSVVGLADVVIRSGIEVAGLYKRYSNASQTVTRLVRDLGGLTDIVLRVRDFATASNLQDPQLENILRDCEGELGALKRDIQNTQQNAGDGWALKVWKGLNWAALDENRMVQSCRDIERYKASLNLILTLIGRQNDSIICRGLEGTREDIANAQAASGTSFLQLEQQNTDISNQNNQGFRDVSSAVQSLSTLGTRHFVGLHSSVGLLSSKIDGLDSSSKSQISSIQGGLSTIEGNLARTETTLVTHQQVFSSRIESKVDKLSAQLRLTQTKDNDFTFKGNNLEAIVVPLTLMQSDFTKAVRTLMSEDSMKLSVSEGRWLQEEFEKLLLSGHEAGVVGCQRRLGRPAPYFMNDQSPTTSYRMLEEGDKQKGLDVVSEGSKPTFIRYIHTAGILQMSGFHQKGSDGSSSLEFQVSFIPNIQFRSVAINLSLLKTFGAYTEPQISRIIRTSNTIADDSKAFKCVQENDIKGLKEQFINGEASPNDCNEHGWSLITHAALHHNLHTFEWLLSQGADILFYTTQSIFHMIWEGGFSDHDISHVTQHVINQGSDHKNTFNIFDVLSNKIPDSEEEITRWISKLTSLGFDIEWSNYLGYTPLLSACTPDYRVFQNLVRMGANVKAISHKGECALHMLLRRYRNGKSMHLASIRESLITALQHGCSPTLSCKNGFTPFDRIRSSKSIWLIWKDVLQETGYLIVDEYFHAMPMLVSTNEEGETRVPISGQPVLEWRERLKPWREEYWCESEERRKLEWESEYESECWRNIQKSKEVYGKALRACSNYEEEQTVWGNYENEVSCLWSMFGSQQKDVSEVCSDKEGQTKTGKASNNQEEAQ